MTLPTDPKKLVGEDLLEGMRNQVAIKGGPLVYCLESIGISGDVRFQDAGISGTTTWDNEYLPILLGGVVVLETEGFAESAPGNLQFGQYRELSPHDLERVPTGLIPYFA